MISDLAIFANCLENAAFVEVGQLDVGKDLDRVPTRNVDKTGRRADDADNKCIILEKVVVKPKIVFFQKVLTKKGPVLANQTVYV